MSDALSNARMLIEELTPEDRQILRRYLQRIAPHELEKRWGVAADVILDAIEKSSDLTKRGLRGILAEAIFESDIVPRLKDGWTAAEINRDEDLPYDSLLIKGDRRVRIQVKLQRSEKGEPKLFHPRHYEEGSLYVVEVQKTRTGTTVIKEPLPDSGQKLKIRKSTTEDTRPYRFGQFDILAVNMQPSTKDWNSFRYTLGDWLLPREHEPTKVAIFQPVAKTPNDVWTDDLATCLRWLEEGAEKRVLAEMKHVLARKKQRKTTKRKPKAP
jgi:hypothetical protein